MSTSQSRIPGRGSDDRTTGRFEKIRVELDLEQLDPDDQDKFTDKVPTEYLVDQSQSVVSTNNSPDIPFEFSLNPYRGCSHGCCYCYARPTHEYLGLGPGLDFESKIIVKPDAPELFRQWLLGRQAPVKPVMMSGVTDCYQPVEKQLELTRQCLGIAWQFRYPIQVITKNSLVLRDIDLLCQLAELQLTGVAISITSLDQSLTRRMEPRTSSPASRLETVRKLSEAGIPVTVMIAPLIPGLNDDGVPKVLEQVADAGAKRAAFITLRLPSSVKPVFIRWLDQHFPDRKQKILSRLRSLRNGRLNSSEFGERMRGTGVWARHFCDVFEKFCRIYGINSMDPGQPRATLRTDLFRHVDESGAFQQRLF